MRFFISILQLFKRQVCVNLGRRQALMAHQALYGLQVSAVVQHGCGKCVAQHVRTPPLLIRHPAQILFHDFLNLVGAQVLAVVADQKPGAHIAVGEILLTGFQVVCDV